MKSSKEYEVLQLYLATYTTKRGALVEANEIAAIHAAEGEGSSGFVDLNKVPRRLIAVAKAPKAKKAETRAADSWCPHAGGSDHVAGERPQVGA
ncbi:MAG: hypothetical protein NXH94_15175 [Rhodobacteraceae bacterium]|uniref:hypothetical protein n=1 Tax=Marivita sp. TaxID=2003365 RepID=UPI003B52A217|nr:hypothetical protein [Paracoccaceae bacterium]